MANASKAKKSQSEKDSSPKKSKKGTSEKSKINSQPDDSLHELFVDGLKDIYWAEKHLVKALPKMEKATSSEQLAEAFASHLAVTQEQVTRLEQVFELLGEKARGKKCDAMEGLVKEAESVIEDTEEGTSTRDVALIIAAQKVEHYEIATYGGLATLAKTLGKNDVAKLLAQTLDEEKETDELLTQLAENNINQSASKEEMQQG